MTEQHTSGPWTVSEPTGTYIQSPVGGIAALTYGAREADARLIAAAPDLLAALEAIEGYLASHAEKSDQAAIGLHNMARAAIAKATQA